jgi:hypothetical protein
VKKALQFLFQILCLFLAGAGALAALLTGCFIAVMGIVWFREGALLLEDKQMLAKAVPWFLGSGVFMCITWWLGRQTGGKRDDSFRLVKSSGGRSEELVQQASQVIFFVVSAIYLWATIPGNSTLKVPMIAGWLIFGYLGLHLRILLHELGHFLVAWSLRFAMRKIQVGVGPRLWACSFANGLLCELRAWPHGGFVFATPRSSRNFRARQFLFVAAGPLTDALILWSAYQLILYSFGGLAAAFVHGAGGLIASVLFWFTAMSAVGGLIPQTVWIGGNKLRSDGYLLFQLCISSHVGPAGFPLNPNWKEALELFQSSSPQTAFLDTGSFCAGEPSACSKAFRQQQARLGSRLLPAAGTAN